MNNAHRIVTGAEARLLRMAASGSDIPRPNIDVPAILEKDQAQADVRQKHAAFENNVKNAMTQMDAYSHLTAIQTGKQGVSTMMDGLKIDVTQLVEKIEQNDATLREKIKRQVDGVVSLIRTMQETYRTAAERDANPYNVKATETALYNSYTHEAIKRFPIGLRLELPPNQPITIRWANGLEDTLPNGRYTAVASPDRFVNSYTTIDGNGRYGNTIYLLGADMPFVIETGGRSELVQRGSEPFKLQSGAAPDVSAVASAGTGLTQSAEKEVVSGELEGEVREKRAKWQALFEEMRQLLQNKIDSGDTVALTTDTNESKTARDVLYELHFANKVAQGWISTRGIDARKNESSMLSQRLAMWENVKRQLQEQPPHAKPATQPPVTKDNDRPTKGLDPNGNVPQARKIDAADAKEKGPKVPDSLHSMPDGGLGLKDVDLGKLNRAPEAKRSIEQAGAALKPFIDAVNEADYDTLPAKAAALQAELAKILSTPKQNAFPPIDLIALLTLRLDSKKVFLWSPTPGGYVIEPVMPEPKSVETTPEPALPAMMRPGDKPVLLRLSGDASVTVLKNEEEVEPLGTNPGDKVVWNDITIERRNGGVLKISAGLKADPNMALNLNIGGKNVMIGIVDLKAEQKAKEAEQGAKEKEWNKKGIEFSKELDAFADVLRNQPADGQYGMMHRAVRDAYDRLMSHAFLKMPALKRPDGTPAETGFFGTRMVESRDGHKYQVRYDFLKHGEVEVRDLTQEQIDADEKAAEKRAGFLAAGKSLQQKLDVLLTDKGVKKMDSATVKAQLDAMQELSAFRAMKKPEAADDAWLKDLDLDYAFTTKDGHEWQIAYNKGKHELVVVDRTAETANRMNEKLEELTGAARKVLADAKAYDGPIGGVNAVFKADLQGLFDYGIGEIGWTKGMDKAAKDEAIKKVFDGIAPVRMDKQQYRLKLQSAGANRPPVFVAEFVSHSEKASEGAKERQKVVDKTVRTLDKYVVEQNGKFVLKGIDRDAYDILAEKLARQIAEERKQLQDLRTKTQGGLRDLHRADAYDLRTVQLNQYERKYVQLGEGPDANVDTPLELREAMQKAYAPVVDAINAGKTPDQIVPLLAAFNDVLDAYPISSQAADARKELLNGAPTLKSKTTGRVFEWKLDGKKLTLSETVDSKRERVAASIEKNADAKKLKGEVEGAAAKGLALLKKNPRLPKIDPDMVARLAQALEAIGDRAGLKDRAFVEKLAASSDAAKEYAEAIKADAANFNESFPVTLNDLTVDAAMKRTPFERKAHAEAIRNTKFEFDPDGDFDVRAPLEAGMRGNAAENLRKVLGVAPMNDTKSFVKLKLGVDGKVSDIAVRNADAKAKARLPVEVTRALNALKGQKDLKPQAAYDAVVDALSAALNDRMDLADGQFPGEIFENQVFKMVLEKNAKVEVKIGNQTVLWDGRKPSVTVGGKTVTLSRQPNNEVWVNVNKGSPDPITFTVVKGGKKGQPKTVTVKQKL